MKDTNEKGGGEPGHTACLCRRQQQEEATIKDVTRQRNACFLKENGMIEMQMKHVVTRLSFNVSLYYNDYFLNIPLFSPDVLTFCVNIVHMQLSPLTFWILLCTLNTCI